MRALNAGAEAFLSKPFDESDLIAQVLSMAKIKAAYVYKLHENERLETMVQERTQKIKQELTERRKLQQELLLSKQFNQQIINCAGEGIVVYDCDLRFKLWNPYMEAMMGILERDILGKSPSALFPFLVSEGAMDNFSKALAGKTTRSLEFQYETPSGYQGWVSDNCSPLYNDAREIIGVIEVVQEISERKRREQEIIYLTQHDNLTGLYNRAYFEEEARRLDNQGILPISIIAGDLNGLKLINDAFGYHKGDQLLLIIADILKRACRSEDVIARVGGDEFYILLPMTGDDAVEEICRKIYERCRCTEFIGGSPIVYPSISLGHATKVNETQALDKKINEAERDMNKSKLLESKSFRSSLIDSIKVTMFEKSHETEAHAERLVALAHPIGKALSLSDNALNELDLLAMLHDIGKMSIEESILSKPGKLNDEEWVKMKQHPEVGYRIAQATPELLTIADYILSHHERWDGKGYPQGLEGEAIPLHSRILAVVDAFDAMTENRPYRSAISKEAAIEEIKNCAGTQFDPLIAELFIERIADASIGGINAS
jgi:diguanylate cyclase (GGDEF)-like protein/PAS domain S-box-containing protein